MTHDGGGAPPADHGAGGMSHATHVETSSVRSKYSSHCESITADQLKHFSHTHDTSHVGGGHHHDHGHHHHHSGDDIPTGNYSSENQPLLPVAHVIYHCETQSGRLERRRPEGVCEGVLRGILATVIICGILWVLIGWIQGNNCHRIPGEPDWICHD